MNLSHPLKSGKAKTKIPMTASKVARRVRDQAMQRVRDQAMQRRPPISMTPPLSCRLRAVADVVVGLKQDAWAGEEGEVVAVAVTMHGRHGAT